MPFALYMPSMMMWHVQVGDALSRVDHRKRRLLLVDRRDVRFDLRHLLGGKPVQLVVDALTTVVEVDADLFERGRVLVEGLFVVDRHTVTEHDGIGDLHHGRFQVQGEQHAVLLREFLHRNGRSAVGVSLTKHGVDRRTENHGEPLLQGSLLAVLGLRGIVGDVVALFLELLDRFLKLGNGSADVGQFDAVGFGGLCQLSEPRELIGDLLIVGDSLGEAGDDPARQGDVGQLGL